MPFIDSTYFVIADSTGRQGVQLEGCTNPASCILDAPSLSYDHRPSILLALLVPLVKSFCSKKDKRLLSSCRVDITPSKACLED